MMLPQGELVISVNFLGARRVRRMLCIFRLGGMTISWHEQGFFRKTFTVDGIYNQLLAIAGHFNKTPL